MINLNTENQSPAAVKENFEKLGELINSHPLLRGTFKFMEIVVEAPTATYKIYHRLGFRPKDVIITYISSGTVTPVYNSFTSETIELNVSSTSTIRLLVGSM